MRIMFLICCLLLVVGALSGCIEQKVEVEQGDRYVCRECGNVIREDVEKLRVPISQEKRYKIKESDLEICYTCAMELKNDGKHFIVGNSSSSCFHEPDCSAAKRIKKSNRTYFSSASLAKRAGYTPCQICKP
jgi:hypothetical protein